MRHVRPRSHPHRHHHALSPPQQWKGSARLSLGRRFRIRCGWGTRSDRQKEQPEAEVPGQLRNARRTVQGRQQPPGRDRQHAVGSAGGPWRCRREEPAGSLLPRQQDQLGAGWQRGLAHAQRVARARRGLPAALGHAFGLRGLRTGRGPQVVPSFRGGHGPSAKSAAAAGGEVGLPRARFPAVVDTHATRDRLHQRSAARGRGGLDGSLHAVAAGGTHSL
mmetsp:Transcript_59423/g.164287  ORF Transcript_59423/g.164287 Transcript_59423/m.164287 type:complete len:220 (-) Transcript_59423:1474-2133(-)